MGKKEQIKAVKRLLDDKNAKYICKKSSIFYGTVSKDSKESTHQCAMTLDSHIMLFVTEVQMEIDSSEFDSLMDTVNKMNADIPVGCYLLDRDGGKLVFRSALVSGKQDEAPKKEIIFHMNLGFEMARKFRDRSVEEDEETVYVPPSGLLEGPMYG